MHTQRIDSKLDQRVDMVCSHVTYEIATGIFEPEAKLPSVRDAAVKWNVDHRIVLKAYKRLEHLGLVCCVPRSGYYVSAGESHDLISRHRFELESMFERFSSEISKTTSLSVLGAFRYLAQLAEIRTQNHPECVFVECTQLQARGHAAEVTTHLSIPCLSMTTGQIAGKATRIPQTVRTILVTAFHYGELKKLNASKRLHVLSVPIEISPELTQRVSKREQVVVFESDEAQAQHMAADMGRLSQQRTCRLEITSDINSKLAEIYSSKNRNRNLQAYLSPRLWGRADRQWRDHSNVHLIEFRIVRSAWPSIADAISLPLGTIPGARI